MAVRRTAHVILTTHGTDGAAAAAMVLQKHPQARIIRTSSTRIGASLLALAKEKPGVVHVCGVGPNDTAEHVLDGLQALARKRCRTIWYCGRGYMAPFAEAMAGVCETAFIDCGSNTGAVQRSLGIGLDERVRLLLALGEQYADAERQRSQAHQFWHDLVLSSAAQYFKYDDDKAFVEAIRKLAGQAEVTGWDERQVDAFRAKGSRALPLGSSPAMRRLRRLVKRLAPIDEPVLILGPSGSGKELVAHLLHEGSARAGAAFVPVNCAVLSTSADLAHDRLFGHVAGAYTGAETDQPGALEAADGGTLFLDEVAELPLAVQTQLLRVLEEGTVMPLGTMTSRPVNVRVVAATNQDLQTRVSDGRFRLDLFHRLNVLTLRVPPLAERRTDMKSIAQAVMHDLKGKGQDLRLTRDDWEAIQSYSWPGNVRQFINLLKRAAFMQMPMTEVLAAEMAENTARQDATAGPVGELLRLFRPPRLEDAQPEAEVRRVYMRHVFELCSRNWTQAAKTLGVSVNTLRKWLQE